MEDKDIITDAQEERLSIMNRNIIKSFNQIGE
jgi:hypothetical protein